MDVKQSRTIKSPKPHISNAIGILDIDNSIFNNLLEFLDTSQINYKY